MKTRRFLAKPRWLFWLCVMSSWLFPAADASAQMARLRRVYAMAGARDDAVVHDVFDGGHQWHGTEALDFLARSLGTP